MVWPPAQNTTENKKNEKTTMYIYLIVVLY